MSTLSGRTPSSTYQDLIRIENSGSGITGSNITLEDGLGISLQLAVSTAGGEFSLAWTFASGSSLTFDNAASLNVNSVNATGAASDVDLTLTPKGTGDVKLPSGYVPGDAFSVTTKTYTDSTFLARDATSLPTADESFDLGSSGAKWSNIYATTFQGEATSAQYADLAERFATDSSLEPGDVVELGGEAEITKSTSEMSLDVFGVVSTNPAYMMNSDAGPDMTHPYVALTGRVPVKCIGKVTKGQRLVTSHVPGAARGINNGTAGSNILAILGRALEDKNTEELGMIEVAIGVK